MSEEDIVIIDDKVFRKRIDAPAIIERIKGIADIINTDYQDKEPVFLITMKGAIFFAAELLKYITIKHQVEIVSAKSYGNEMTSGDEVIVLFNGISFENREIVLMEDIVDTGKTIIQLTKNLSDFKPKSIKLASMLSKPNKHIKPIQIDYLCFELFDNDFIIGFGLDYKEYGRSLSGLYFLEPSH